MIGLPMGLIGVYGAANIVRWIFGGLAIQFPPQTRNPAHRPIRRLGRIFASLQNAGCFCALAVPLSTLVGSA